MKRFIYIQLCFIIPIFVCCQQPWNKSYPMDYAWQNVGNAGFSAGSAFYTVLAFNPSGQPYVGYQGGNTYATVMKFDGNNWVNVGNPSFSDGAAYYISLAFNSNGEPYVAYENWGNSGKASVMKFDGTSWVYVGAPGFTPGETICISLAFSPSWEPYIAFFDYTQWGGFVMKFDGTNWVYIGSDGFTDEAALFVSFAFSSSGEPYVAYSDQINSWKATVKKFNGSGWVNVGNAGFSAGRADWTSLAFSPAGQPYLAFLDEGNSNKATVMKFDGTSWVNVGSPGFSAGKAFYTSLAFNPSAEPYVAYADSLNYNDWKATVKKFDGSGWVNVGNSGFSAGRAWYTSLAFNQSGNPFVAYMDFANNDKATVMKYDSVFVGINESQTSQFFLYPNPVATKLTIDLKNLPGKMDYFEITDIRGMNITEFHSNERKIILDVESYPAGIYFVKLKIDDSFYIGKFCKN